MGKLPVRRGAHPTAGPMFSNLRQYLRALEREGELAVVERRPIPTSRSPRSTGESSPKGAQRSSSGARRGRDSRLPPICSGTAKRIELAFGARPKDFVRELARAAVDLLPPTPSKLWGRAAFVASDESRDPPRAAAPVLEVRGEPRLGELPILTSAPLDAGAFVTLPLVYTEHPDPTFHQSNLGIYRLQVFDDPDRGIPRADREGGGFHFHEAERLGIDLPATVFLGGPPALTLAAIAPLPEGIPELLLASLARGARLETAAAPGGGHPLVAEAEWALRGRVRAGMRRIEGPFGDHYGYYSLAHEYPVLELDEMWHRKDPIYPATIVGKPKQEDFFLGDYLQELLSPLFPLVMPAVVNLWSYGETGFHSLAAAVVKDRYPREALQSAFRILGEGQLSLTKFLLLTDARVDLRDFRGLLEHLLARCRFESDLFVFSNVLDGHARLHRPQGQRREQGGIVGIGGAGPRAPARVRGALPAGRARRRSSAADASSSRGTAMPTIRGSPRGSRPIRARPPGRSWSSPTTPPRQRPAPRPFVASVHPIRAGRRPPRGRGPVVRNHLAYRAPIVVDARVKPWFPGEVDPDPATVSLVNRRWKEYFPDR